KATIPSSTAQGIGIEAQPDGKLLVPIGYTAILRMTAQGDVDTAFGQGASGVATVTLPDGTPKDAFRSISIRSDDAIPLGFPWTRSSVVNAGMVRLTSSGAPVATNGVASNLFSSTETYPVGYVALPTGETLGAALNRSGASGTMTVFRLTAQLALD